jgi:hypothetical protein
MVSGLVHNRYWRKMYVMETCNWCDREIVDEVPEESGPARCGGLACGHRTIYGLWNEDCRQVILRREDYLVVTNAKESSTS